MHINFPDDSDFATLIDFAKTTAQLIDPLITGQIVKVGIGWEIPLTDITGPSLASGPLSTSDVEEGARFQFGTEINSITGFRIPTFDETFMVAGTRLVNTADSAVDALIDRIIDGRTVGIVNVQPSDMYGNDVTYIEDAREAFESSRG